MKRTVPLLITAFAGIILVISVFVPQMVRLGEDTAVWFDLLAAIAFILGGGNLLKVHLKKISDRAAGWGYSGVTILAFLLTLYFGLFKVGVNPEASTEYYGESFVHFPLEHMPIYYVDGKIPTRTDGERLPASSILNLSQDGSDISRAPVDNGSNSDDDAPGDQVASVIAEQLPHARRTIDDAQPPADETETAPDSAPGNSSRVVFRGWMSTPQRNDLQEYDTSLEWQCLVEQLHQQAQPRFARGRVLYHSNHEMLGFVGYMSDADFDNLTEMLANAPDSRGALQQLLEASRVEHTVAIPAPRQGVIDALAPPSSDGENGDPDEPTPADDLMITSFVQPASERVRPDEPPQPWEFLRLDQGTLTILGPMTPRVRNQLAEEWPDWPRVRPLPGENNDDYAAARERLAHELIAELEALGPELTDEQREAVEKQFATVNDVQIIIEMINAAGVASEGAKSPCELLAELRAWERAQAESPDGNSDALVLDPTTPKGEDVVLSEDQEDVIRQFAGNPEISIDDLEGFLQELETEPTGLPAAAAQVLSSQPTAAFFKHQMAFAVLKAGPLSDAQKNWLFADYITEFEWRQAIDKLFYDAHVVKYSWSGSHEQEGSLFWWCYAFLFRPLVATMFAMLAFYVASAAFRAFRAKNVEALLLLGTAFIILLGRTFVGVWITGWIPPALSAFKVDELTLYVMQIFTTAGNRAIMIGIALGVASTSLKVLLGVDRSYLGSGDE